VQRSAVQRSDGGEMETTIAIRGGSSAAVESQALSSKFHGALLPIFLSRSVAGVVGVLDRFVCQLYAQCQVAAAANQTLQADLDPDDIARLTLLFVRTVRAGRSPQFGAAARCESKTRLRGFGMGGGAVADSSRPWVEEDEDKREEGGRTKEEWKRCQ
jgi:hypothetical protein